MISAAALAHSQMERSLPHGVGWARQASR